MIFCLIILAAIIVKGTIPFVIVYSDYAYCIFHTSTMDLLEIFKKWHGVSVCTRRIDMSTLINIHPNYAYLPIHRNLSSYSCFKNI